MLKGFCGGPATDSGLRKGDKTQPHNLNHHMEEKMKITAFSLFIETISR
jgi:truncated hemoglobin YjbI